jgi:hypothetical protein
MQPELEPYVFAMKEGDVSYLTAQAGADASKASSQATQGIAKQQYRELPEWTSTPIGPYLLHCINAARPADTQQLLAGHMRPKQLKSTVNLIHLLESA